ncbi:monofunctional biosynthetic peptidoglycan transglycosylase [Wenxinia saemankumensis]|uniref:Biosynthetic peptidoglycan transglycosylase n=1 Tax=Wenxinia saemankumensis TaxID=1447782 RepID=A0A1M6FR68_9RHOB|nr:monofunctional biosynthetic peptidoglycan transglycosylase [Wenxinia saemankumensis]SHJ00191.1 monofunctional biosynthetic peptidoglycan transglycosylase [Wenxinia saemankumensis]
MARRKTEAERPRRRVRPLRWLGRWLRRAVLAAVALLLALIALYAVVNPPGTIYMAQQYGLHGRLDRDWVPMEEIAPVMARAAVAAEDANFCLHWGLDLDAIRAAMAAGGDRGASTISQQTVKNVFLWHGRSWLRKALEAAITPAVELVWPKRRILEVYLNVAEFDTGVFGVEAAARHYFGTSAADLTAPQAALLAAILPDPQGRSAASPSDFVRRRARSIEGGAATILADGRDACFAG